MRFDCPHSQVPAATRVLVASITMFVVLAALSLAPRVLTARAEAAAWTAVQTPQHPEPVSHEGGKQGRTGEEQHGSGWLALIAKIVNFSILVFVLVYFLREPVAAHLGSRGTQIRQALVTAADTRAAATRQLAQIQAKLAALPAELEALKARGAEEIAAEQVRIEQAAQAERQRLLEQARREIETRLRMARRELLEHAANLAVQVASRRIQTTITPDDQARLVDRYTAQLAEANR